MNLDIESLEKKTKELRKIAFEMVINANKGHLGGSFSCAEILAVLFYKVMYYDINNLKSLDRDRFVMSKGHANNFLYAILADLGFIKKKLLNTYTKNGSILGGHCDFNIYGIDASTGSLGHGLGIACGIAFANKLDDRNNITYSIIGDGESQEGSIWESILFAGQHKLSNLIVFLDRNNIGAECFIKENLDLEPLDKKLEAFNWKVKKVDGHSIKDLLLVINEVLEDLSRDKPVMIIANTIKGKGISCLENLSKSHHTLPKGDDVEKTLRELS